MATEFINIPYSDWKTLVNDNSWDHYNQTAETETEIIYSGNSEKIIKSLAKNVTAEESEDGNPVTDWTDWNTNFSGTATAVGNDEEVLLKIIQTESITLETSVSVSIPDSVSTSEGAGALDPSLDVRQKLLDGGESSMLVDGSSVAKEYVLAADADDDILIYSLRFVFVANRIRVESGKFSPLGAALTNGIKIEVRSDSTTTQLALIKETGQFLEFHDPLDAIFDRSGPKDHMIAQRNFPGTKLVAASGDFVKVTIQDDMTSALFEILFASVSGQKKE